MQMRKPKLLDQMCREMRARHLSRRTEKAYLGWVRRFILFHGKRHPAEMAEREVNAFLTAGNVWEWILDRREGGGLNRLKGGAFYEDAGGIGAAARIEPPPGSRFVNFSFRCVFVHVSRASS